MNIFALPGSHIYESIANNLHEGSQDYTTSYMILGKECDLPNPLIFEAFMADKLIISPEPFIKKCKSLDDAENLYSER